MKLPFLNINKRHTHPTTDMSTKQHSYRHTLWAFIAIGLLTSCRSHRADTPSDDHAQETYVRLIVSDSDGLRAAETDDNGTAQESSVTGGKVLTDKGTHTIPTFTQIGTANVFKSAPFPIAPGSTQMTLVINGAHLAPTSLSQGKEIQENANISDYIRPNAFVMTSTAFATTILPGITATMIDNEDTQARPNILVKDIERVVAKVLVTSTANRYEIRVENNTVATVSGFSYAVANGAKHTYLTRDHAGDRTMGADNIYNDYTSAIHTKSYTRADIGTAPDFLVRLGDTPATTKVGGTSPYAARALGKATYVFENSSTAAPGDFHYARQAYIKVYATFVPTVVADRNLSAVALPTDGTFYKGNIDGILYDSAASATHGGRNTAAYKYTKGKTVYLLPVNQQLDATGKKTVNANIRRNNFYHITFTSIVGLGFNYDPNDPNDPNIPKPKDNPNEPQTPPDDNDDNIDRKTQWFYVDCRVSPWTHIVYDNVLM